MGQVLQDRSILIAISISIGLIGLIGLIGNHCLEADMKERAKAAFS